MVVTLVCVAVELAGLLIDTRLPVSPATLRKGGRHRSSSASGHSVGAEPVRSALKADSSPGSARTNRSNHVLSTRIRWP